MMTRLQVGRLTDSELERLALWVEAEQDAREECRDSSQGDIPEDARESMAIAANRRRA